MQRSNKVDQTLLITILTDLLTSSYLVQQRRARADQDNAQQVTSEEHLLEDSALELLKNICLNQFQQLF